MPKRKSVKNGTTEELVKELDPTEGKGEGAPGGKRATPSNRKATQKKGKGQREEAAKEQAAAEEAAKEKTAAEETTERGMKWEELEEEDFGTPRSGLCLITATDLKKGTAARVIDGKKITVNIKAIAKELSVRLGRELEEEEWKVWARFPVGDIDSVLGMAAERP